MTVQLNATKRTLRTVFAAVVGLAAMAPLIYSAAAQGDPQQATGWLGGVLGIAAAVTRIMALPVVEVWLQKFIPWLSADPNAEHVTPPDDVETPADPDDRRPSSGGYVISNVPGEPRDADSARVVRPDRYQPERAYPEEGGPPLT